MDFLGQTWVSGNVIDEADRMIASDLQSAYELPISLATSIELFAVALLQFCP